MNLNEMIALVRLDLHDTDSAGYRWTDAALARHISRALAELSESIPAPVKATMPTVPGSRELDISSLSPRIMVTALEYPAGSTPPDHQQFSIWGDTLTIVTGLCPDGRNCHIFYGTGHSIDASGSTLPERLMDTVAGGACGFAASELALYLINRVNTGGTGASGELTGFGNDKLKIFRQELKRLGRRNRIRVNDLSATGSAPASTATDYGP
jgi:hypothetical protein